MNDVLTEKKPYPDSRVKDRALKLDGKKSQFDTGLKSETLSGGATFCIWAQVQKPEQKEQACIGAAGKEGQFALGANLKGVPGYGVVVKNGEAEAKIVAAMPAEADTNWHHLAATLDAKGLRFFFDGRPSGSGQGTALPPEAEFYLGSCGQQHYANAILDEARIYARVLDPKEITAIYESERPRTPPPKTPAPKTARAESSSSKAAGEGATTPKPSTPKPAASKPSAAKTPTPKPAR